MNLGGTFDRFELNDNQVVNDKIQPKVADLGVLVSESNRLLPAKRDPAESKFVSHGLLVETLE